MTIAFTAAEILIERSEANVILGLSSGGPRPVHRVILMRPLAQAEAAGDVLSSEAYFEYLSGEQGGFGCVVRASLEPATLVLICDRRRCPALPDDRFEVAVPLDHAQRREVEAAVRDLFDVRQEPAPG